MGSVVRVDGGELVTTAEAAQRVGVTVAIVKRWRELGLRRG